MRLLCKINVLQTTTQGYIKTVTSVNIMVRLQFGTRLVELMRQIFRGLWLLRPRYSSLSIGSFIVMLVVHYCELCLFSIQKTRETLGLVLEVPVACWGAGIEDEGHPVQSEDIVAGPDHLESRSVHRTPTAVTYTHPGNTKKTHTHYDTSHPFYL